MTGNYLYSRECVESEMEAPAATLRCGQRATDKEAPRHERSLPRRESHAARCGRLARRSCRLRLSLSPADVNRVSSNAD